MNSRIRTPFYIFFLNPDYVAARCARYAAIISYCFVLPTTLLILNLKILKT